MTLIEERGTGLAVGFNRRHAPRYAQCAEHPRELDHHAEEPHRPARGTAHDDPRRPSTSSTRCASWRRDRSTT
ncbi:hypothetical protein LV779_35625 [Streptomyces thinghirensis]|nr:hypothetical protein [Streptomyces thinghirensis]